MRQMTLDDMLAATRKNDPDTSLEAASHVKVRPKQRLTLQAMLELRRHDTTPVEAWRVRKTAQRIQSKTHPNARPMGESTIRTRLHELCTTGFVALADRDGLTESNGRCGRYTLTPKGVSEAKEAHDDE